MTGPTPARRPRTIAAPSRTSASAPVLEDRIAELEDRLARMESRRPSMEGARSWFEQVMPPEASRHFKTAMKEQLLGVRTLVDHWIKRLERERQPSDRETIRID